MSAGVALLAALCAVATPLVAQTVTATTGAVNGAVTDVSKAVASRVIVTLSGAPLVTIRTTATDQEGAYRFSAVPPGDYGLTFELDGFAKLVRGPVHVGLGFTATVDAELQPEGITDSLVVTGAPVIDLGSTSVTTHFDSERLATLWFGNVERVASERIGRETVTYVSNIYKYYITYRLLSAQRERREAAKRRWRSADGILRKGKSSSK